MRETRPDPDALLAEVETEGEKGRAARGRLKVFFGAAPGVGKTYAMLEAVRQEAKEGREVLVGYVEPHARPETHALLLGLDLLDRRMVEHRGAALAEFDLEAALARRPSLVVVDELAHTNAPGSTNEKRWQDVEDLLRAGVDVFTTLNVQHLESLNDVVSRITGVVVRETVPDRVFDEAHEVELVDLPPDDLLERLNEGKVYVPDQAARAVESFFRKGNLIALRELALRRTAERVGAQVRDYRQAHAIARTWPTSDRLLVCVGPSPTSPRLVRAAKRMAAGSGSRWAAVHVEVPAAAHAAGAREQLLRTLQLAERLGGEAVTLTGQRAVDEILHYARRNNVTRILVGKPKESRWKEFLWGSFVYELTRKSGDIDVYVISGEPDEAPRPGGRAETGPIEILPYVYATLVVAACTLAGWATLGRLAPVNQVMVYLFGVVVISLRFGQGASAWASVLSVLAFDFFFVIPYLTFAVDDTQYLLTFAVMLVTGLVISTLTARVRAQVDLSRSRETRTRALYTLGRDLSSARGAVEIAGTLVRAIEESRGAKALVALPDAGAVTVVTASQGLSASAHDLVVATWVLKNGRPAGLGTATLPGASLLFVPLLDAGEPIGVVGVRPDDVRRAHDPEWMRLVDAFADQGEVALARVRYAAEAERVRLEVETERLRNALLSTVSHDLRTPLAAIAGAASTLLSGEASLPPDTRRELLSTVVEETEGLNRLIGNLLFATRLGARALTPNKDWQSIEELFGAVANRLDSLLGSRPIRVEIPADLPLVSADGALVQQVLTNLLENAVKYSPPGTPIDVAVGATGAELTVEVADRGHGFSAGEEMLVFEKFHRSAGTAGRPGVGLGLTICRGIVELHGGRIWAGNRAGGGAVVRFTLPVAKQPPAPAELAAEETDGVS